MGGGPEREIEIERERERERETRRARVRDRPALWEGGGCELTRIYRQPTHKREPLGVVLNRSALQCSKALSKTLN